jgi:DNA-binding response OmpR family regulator
LSIDFHRQQAWLEKSLINLTTNEFAVLNLMVRHAGKVLDRDEILQTLRGIDSDPFNRTVDITISRLRQKLTDNPKNPEFIKTIWNVGYVFIAEESDNEPPTV